MKIVRMSLRRGHASSAYLGRALQYTDEKTIFK